MRTLSSFLITVILFLGITSITGVQSNAQGSGNTTTAVGPDSSALKFYSRFQTLGILQNLKDNFRNKTRMYLYLKQARLGAMARYEGIDFDIQLAFGGEEEVKAPSPGVALSLLDLSADVPITGNLRLKVGQYRVPYGRENLSNDGYLQFTDLSIQNLGFKLGRDVGIALHANSGTFTSIFGIFTGGGRDVPIRYIPLDIGIPMMVARIGINNGLDENLFSVKANMFDSNIGYAFFVNALYTKDSKVGHSSALNVKLADKSLLLNGNWNPFIGKSPLDRSEFWQIGADVAAKISGKERGLSAEAEVNYGSFNNIYGSLSLLGGRAQGAYFVNPVEIAVRYAFLRPDDNFGVKDNTGTIYKIVDRKLIHEITTSVSYYIRGNRVKLTAELPLFINAPVVTEPNLGAYPLLAQPDQTTVIASQTKTPADRQTVVEARLQLQVMF